MPVRRNAQTEVADLIARFSEGFVSGKMSAEEATWVIDELLDLADEALPRIVEMLSSPDEDTRRVAITLLRELEDSRAVRPLQRALRNPDYSDEEKISVLCALDELGAPVDEATFRRAIVDPKALAERSLNKLLETISDPVQVEMYLAAMEEQMLPEAQEYCVLEALKPTADRRLLLLLSALLHNEHDSVVVAAIDAIESLKEPATIPLLEERARHDPSRRVRHTAENTALRLQTRIGDHPAQPWVTPSPLPLTHCILSTIDGSGGQVLFITREHPGGDMLLLDLMFNDHEGIKDCFSIVVDEEELNDMMDVFGESIEFMDVKLERARDEIARAYQVTLDARRRLPPVFMAWRGWLEGEDTRSIEEFPLPALDPSRQAELLAECAELLTLDEFSYWFFNPDEVEAFVPRYHKLRRKNRAERGQPPFEALLDEAIKGVVDKKYRRLLADRLRRQAWLLAQVYEEEEIPLWALAAAAALEEGALVEHPLLRDMMDDSFQNAVGQH